MASVIEQCQVEPHPSGAAELTLRLTYFDHTWLAFGRNRRLLFYNLPISKPHFVQTIIPSLKHSLSLALKHYTILAGNLVCPIINSSGYPELRYNTGDSVSVIFSETIDMNFNYLIGNHPRNAKDLYPLIPQLAEPKDAPGVQLAPILAIKVTLFPNFGISIGFSNHHAACDGNTIVRFTRAWALLNKFCGDEQFLENDQLIPFYDRSIIKDPHEQGMSIWDVMKTFKVEMRDIIVIPDIDKVRCTFIIGHNEITKLKNLILSRRPSLAHVTSFTITCAYVWTCLVKSEVTTIEITNENVMEFFVCAADCRARINPPLPPSYFGNCVMGYVTQTRRIDLIGKEGFTIAVELIGEVIQKRTKDKEWILSGNWFKEFSTIDTKRLLSVSGSPKFDLYSADFGWGKAEKIESVSIDNGGSMSLTKSKDSNGDLEVGLSLSKAQMNAFAAIFTHGLSLL
ncbi:anthocyanin 5-aromatic acyltransferase-like [Solanum tuberosum]|uniref:Malonyltransferase n=1 Tax=Solanum tuberosum TaxID=4113 RepID=M1A7W9_SOLTU|nr:PREDICTED: anthocyanin 5-aromatic acyltransferase-like [Solanum tuberosum]